MLTAVSDFVGDSFSTRDGLLEQLRAGDLNILLHRSGPLMLAGLITDPPPAALNERLQGMVEQVRESYSYLVDDQWNGSGSLLECVREELKALLYREGGPNSFTGGPIRAAAAAVTDDHRARKRQLTIQKRFSTTVAALCDGIGR